MDEPTRAEFCSSIPILFSYIIQNSSKKIAVLATCSHAGFLLGLFFNIEDGSDMFL
jgi:hypothetical protein